MSNEPSPQEFSNLNLPKYIIFAFLAYEALVVALLANELWASSFRATDKILILLGLIFLPVLLFIVSEYVSRAGRINITYGELELKFDRLRTDVVEVKTEAEKANERSKKLEERFEGKLSTAEQTLYPIIGGADSLATDRLRNEKKLFIGCRDFASNIVVVELVTRHLNFEIQGYECVKKFANAGVMTNYAYLKNHWVDLIVNYTGTGCTLLNIDPRNISPDSEEKPPQKLLEILNERSKSQFNAEWVQLLGTKTNYCIVMQKEKAERMDIKKISDLSAYRKKLKFCGDYDFINRPDGLVGIKQNYSLRFAEEIACSYDERYTFLEEDKADITVGHTTDPEIQGLEFRILEDDQKFLLDYWECPVVRLEALEIVGGLREALEKLSNLKISNQDITNLVDDYTENPDSVSQRVNELLAQKRNLRR